MSDIGTNDLVIDGSGPDRAGRICVGGRSDAHQIRQILAEILLSMGNLNSGNFGTIAANGGTATASAAYAAARAGMQVLMPPPSTTATLFTVHGMVRVQAVECATDGVITMTAQNFNTATKSYSNINMRNFLGIR